MTSLATGLQKTATITPALIEMAGELDMPVPRHWK